MYFSVNLEENYSTSGITWKFTRKQRGKRKSRAPTENGLVTLEPKLPKATVSAARPGASGNARELSSALGTPLVTPRTDRTGQAWAPTVPDARSRSKRWVHHSLRGLHSGHALSGWHWNVCFYTHIHSQELSENAILPAFYFLGKWPI